MLDSERIEIERDRALKEADWFDRVHQATNRRLDLDEKRFAVEVEERKQMLERRFPPCASLRVARHPLTFFLLATLA